MSTKHNDYSDIVEFWRSLNTNLFYLYAPTVKKCIYNNPATIVFWNDGTKTVVKCQTGDTYSKELGLAMCFAKKMLGNKGNYYNKFKKLLEEEK